MKSKITQFHKYLLLICLSLFTTGLFAQSGCDASIKVYKNRYIKSVSTSGVYYQVFLTNNGSSQDTYSLSTQNVNDSCSNKDGSSTANNVELNFSTLNSDESPITEITVNSGETKSFLIAIDIPINTPLNRWSCNEVIATSQSCNNYSTRTILKNYVVDPNDE